MECYVFDAGNLHQTTTSRNEGAHHALRSNASILSKLSTSYLLRRQHNTIWMKRLRGNAIRSANRIDLDIDIVPELRELKKKISLFALREMRRQINQAKLEEVKGEIRNPWDERTPCDCHTYRRYGLPCWHMVPTNGTAIPLENIAPF